VEVEDEEDGMLPLLLLLLILLVLLLLELLLDRAVLEMAVD
jgi:hypothetical protein